MELTINREWLQVQGLFEDLQLSRAWGARGLVVGELLQTLQGFYGMLEGKPFLICVSFILLCFLPKTTSWLLSALN